MNRGSAHMHPADHDVNNHSSDIPSSHNGMVSEVDVIEYNGGLTKKISPVVRESSLCIRLNGDPVVTLLCSDSGREYLAIGFLAMEGFIQPDEMESIRITEIDAEGIDIEAPCGSNALSKDAVTRTPGLGRGVTFSSAEERLASVKITSSQRILPRQVFGLMEGLFARSTLYKQTHGVHNAALCIPDGIEIFHFDLGRHNAIDKLYGQCILEKRAYADRIIVTSGRISSEMLVKAGVMGVPLLISRSAPTDRAVMLARMIGLTLVGRAQENRFVVYSHPERIMPPGEYLPGTP